MNRRGFLGAMLKAGAAFAVLPSALTYARQWKPTDAGLVVPTGPAIIEMPIGPRYHAVVLKLSGVGASGLNPLSEISVNVNGYTVRRTTLKELDALNTLTGELPGTVWTNRPWP